MQGAYGSYLQSMTLSHLCIPPHLDFVFLLLNLASLRISLANRFRSGLKLSCSRADSNIKIAQISFVSCDLVVRCENFFVQSIPYLLTVRNVMNDLGRYKDTLSCSST